MAKWFRYMERPPSPIVTLDLSAGTRFYKERETGRIIAYDCTTDKLYAVVTIDLSNSFYGCEELPLEYRERFYRTNYTLNNDPKGMVWVFREEGYSLQC